jgi:hypothetical protein
MALDLYRRHAAGKCIGGHAPRDSFLGRLVNAGLKCSYEPEELRPGWRTCDCPIYASGYVNKEFINRDTERVLWDEARAVAATWETASHPPPTEQTGLEKRDDSATGELTPSGTDARPTSAPNSELGLISPTGPRASCCKCHSAIDRDLTTVQDILRMSETICPRFCPRCERWHHHTCRTSPNSLCPDCGKVVLTANSFYCPMCAREVRVKAAGSWPHIVCIRCGNPISLAALGMVGLSELFGLGALGFVSVMAFIILALPGRGDLLWQLQQVNTSDPKAIITGISTAILLLPWFVLCAGLVLTSGAYPTHGSLLVRQGRDFRMKSRWHRFLDVYLWAVTLGATRRHATASNWRNVADPQCPKCGSPDIRRAGGREYGTALVMAGVFVAIWSFVGFALGWPSWVKWVW